MYSLCKKLKFSPALPYSFFGPTRLVFVLVKLSGGI